MLKPCLNMHASIGASMRLCKITASGSMHYDSAAWNTRVLQMLAQVPHASARADMNAHCRDEGI